MTSGTLTFLSPRRLVQLDAYNGGASSATITVSCSGLPNVVASLAMGQLSTISTGWTSACASVTIKTSNGWDTNFDNLVIQ